MEADEAEALKLHIQFQEVLDHHGVSDAAECIEERKEYINASKLES